ncbi:TPA: hypothetical protein PMC50_002838 [Vibrio cholerae]|nr:hypothetical protein [Vibrio cholerae]
MTTEPCKKCGSTERYDHTGRCKGCRAIYNKNRVVKDKSRDYQMYKAVMRVYDRLEEERNWIKPPSSTCTCEIITKGALTTREGHRVFYNKNYDDFSYFKKYNLCAHCNPVDVDNRIYRSINQSLGTLHWLVEQEDTIRREP